MPRKNIILACNCLAEFFRKEKNINTVVSTNTFPFHFFEYDKWWPSFFIYDYRDIHLKKKKYSKNDIFYIAMTFSHQKASGKMNQGIIYISNLPSFYNHQKLLKGKHISLCTFVSTSRYWEFKCFALYEGSKNIPLSLDSTRTKTHYCFI